jgi:hypothetical protein
VETTIVLEGKTVNVPGSVNSKSQKILKSQFKT